MKHNPFSLVRGTRQSKIYRQIFYILLSTFSLFLVLGIILPSSVLHAEQLGKQPTHTQETLSKDLHAHWAYLGVQNPRHWGMLSEEYKTCETGNRQSPINITMTHHGDHQQKLAFHYQTSQLHEMNNGHTIQVSHVSGCRVDLNDRQYELRQFHFHSPSEHHIEGKAFPMEMHLVHQDETGHVLVIAIMMETDATQSVLRKFWKWLPEQTDKKFLSP
jgi:carbonic anhydrase